MVLPRDWVRGNAVEKGDVLEVEYDGVVTVKAPENEAKPAARSSG